MTQFWESRTSDMKQQVRVLGYRNLRRWPQLAMAAICLLAGFSVARAQFLESPMRIAEGPPGQMLVSDSRQDKVFAIDQKRLAPVWSFAVPGTPMAVAFAANLVFIGNASTQNVEVYRLKGTQKGSGKTLEFLFNLGLTPIGVPGNIRTPSDIDLDKDAQLAFVLDSGERKVKVFDFAGNIVSAFPALSDPPLLSPTAIAVDTLRQEVLVSDYGDPNGSFFSTANVPARIMIYTYSGMFLAKIDGGVDTADYQFGRPQGLATDNAGHIFMAESLLGQIYVFDRSNGSVVKKLGGFGDGPGELQLPLDLFIDKHSQDMFVTNNMLRRIEIFRAAGGLQ